MSLKENRGREDLAAIFVLSGFHDLMHALAVAVVNLQ